MFRRFGAEVTIVQRRSQLLPREDVDVAEEVANILGVEGGEVMSVIQVAMMAGLPYTALRDGIFAHPTLAESLNTLFLALDNRRS